MKVDLKPGIYVVGVSGGVDSMVLLDLLTKQPKLKLIVAHFDHGIRNDSKKDRLLVQQAAEKYKLPFVFDEGSLGPKTSEDKARQARYGFLEKVKKAAGAQAIVTAHHLDDRIETAIINLLRGTYRNGLSSLQSREDIIRPLLNIPKADLIKYAKTHGIKWREDPTNQDINYLRNRVRHEIVPKLSVDQRKKLLGLIDKAHVTNKELNEQIANFLQFVRSKNGLDRAIFNNLPHNLAREVMASWLREHNVSDLTSKRLELLVRAAKTYPASKQADVNKSLVLKLKIEKIELTKR